MSCLCAFQFFLPIYMSDEIIVSFGLTPFDICYNNPTLWKYIKISFIFFYIFSNYIIIHSIISRFHIFEKVTTQTSTSITKNDSSLQLLIGKDIFQRCHVLAYNFDETNEEHQWVLTDCNGKFWEI